MFPYIGLSLPLLDFWAHNVLINQFRTNHRYSIRDYGIIKITIIKREYLPLRLLAVAASTNRISLPIMQMMSVIAVSIAIFEASTVIFNNPGCLLLCAKDSGDGAVAAVDNTESQLRCR